MALKLRRGLEVFTNGMLQHRVAESPPHLLGTGADSFKRLLGSADNGVALWVCNGISAIGLQLLEKAIASLVAREPRLDFRDTDQCIDHYATALEMERA